MEVLAVPPCRRRMHYRERRFHSSFEREGSAGGEGVWANP